MRIVLIQTPAVLTVCMAIIWLSGCSKSFTAREYPSFYDPNVRTVAVLPFQNETNARGAGMLAAENPAAALRANGTYRIIPPRRVQAFIVGTALRDSAIASPYPQWPCYPSEYVPAGRVRTELADAGEGGEGDEGDEGGDFGDDFDHDFGV